MFFTSSNWQDIDKYYSGTYVKFKEHGDRLFYIKNVDPNSITGIDEDEQVFELYLHDSHPYEIDYILPSRAIFQYGKKVVMLQRNPARQYKRGLCSNNVRVIDLYTGDTMPIGFNVLKAFVNKQKYYSIDDAVKKKYKLNSYALSPRFSYHAGQCTFKVDTKTVGVYEHTSKKIGMKPLFMDEFKALMSEHSPIEVIAYE